MNGSLVGDPLGVLERVLDVDVSVEGDGAQVDDARRRAHHVRRDPHLAEGFAQHPGVQVVHECERHHQSCNRCKIAEFIFSFPHNFFVQL